MEDFKIADALLKEDTILKIENWLDLAPGEFTVQDVDRDLDFATPEMRAIRTDALEYFVESKKIERVGKRRGCYRSVVSLREEIDFINANEKALKIWLPFNMHRLVEIMPGNIIICAGEWNSGKTAFCLNLIRGNHHDFNLHYFNSEMDGGELKKRLLKFNDMTLSMWRFKAYSRAEDFSDVIFPGEGNINVIDFLEVHDEFYKVGQWIKDIHSKLHGAVAVICLQKNQGVDMGLGGNRSMEKARLSLAMEAGKIKIIKAKNYATETNPNGLCVNYKLVGGCNMIQQGNWYNSKKETVTEAPGMAP